MSRRSIPADDEDLHQPLLPSDGLLRQPTLPHSTQGVTTRKETASGGHGAVFDFDSNDDCSSVDSIANLKPNSIQKTTTHHRDPAGTVTISASPSGEIDDDIAVSLMTAPSRGQTQSYQSTSNTTNPNSAAVGTDRRHLAAPLGARTDQPPTPIPAVITRSSRGQTFRHKRIKRVSNYILGPLMGVGSYGHVRDAIDLSKQDVERVAVKTIQRKNRSEAELQRLTAVLENEVEHLQRYHHLNIIRAVDIFHRDGKDYIVLPVAVCSLEQLVQFRRQEITKRKMTLFSDKSSTVSGVSALLGGASSPSAPHKNLSVVASQLSFSPRALFPTQLVKDIIFQLLSGLSYLHKQGIAHNDLKPANVLLYKDGTVKITDLGSCASTYRGRGTPAFVSPQVAGASCAADEIDPRKNDVWSCGVLLFYLLTNMMPFHKENEYQLYNSIAKCEVNFDLVPCEEYDPPSMNTSLSAMPTNGGAAAAGSQSSSSRERLLEHQQQFSYSFASTSSTAKGLLRLLMEKDQERRISASEALQHPWLAQMAEAAPHASNGAAGKPVNASPAKKTPSGEQLASGHIARSANNLKRVFNVKELQSMMDHDEVQHLQFVCEAAFAAGITIPSTVFRSDAEDVDDDDVIDGLPSGPLTEPTRMSGESSVAPGPRATAAIPAKTHDNDTSDMPRGVIFRGRFLGLEELGHYNRKGKPDCDVRTLRADGQKKVMLSEYLQVLIACRGYFGKKRQSQARGVVAGDENGGKRSGKEGDGGSSGSVWKCCCAMM